jgi:hypothetical protein
MVNFVSGISTVDRTTLWKAPLHSIDPMLVESLDSRYSCLDGAFVFISSALVSDLPSFAEARAPPS